MSCGSTSSKLRYTSASALELLVSSATYLPLAPLASLGVSSSCMPSNGSTRKRVATTRRTRSSPWVVADTVTGYTPARLAADLGGAKAIVGCGDEFGAAALRAGPAGT